MGFPWKTRVVVAAALAVVAVNNSLVEAQTAAPPITRSQATVVRLKPDMVQEWIDLQKNEVIPAQKKGGLASRTTLQTTIGNAFEYVTIIPVANFAALDGQNPQQKALGVDGAARLAERIRRCVLTQYNYILNRRDDLTIPQGTALVARTVIRHPLPGKQGDYLTYIKTDLLPVMKKAKDAGKIAGYTVSLRGEGAPTAGEVGTTTYYNKFADLDAGNPAIAVVGQTAATAMTAKGAALATNAQVIVRRRVAELSF
jgi:hypothetical protein